MKYEVILFDADETLFDFNKAEASALEKTMIGHGIDYDDEFHLGHYRKINRVIWDEFENNLITVKDLKVERYRRFFEELGMSINPKEFSHSYLLALGEMAFLFNGAKEILDELHKEYKLVLITNGLAKVQRSRLEKTLLQNYFDSIIISEEIGVSKPNVGIFEHAFESIRHSNKSTALIVGDSLKSDIKGGLNFGIDTCWYNPEGIVNNTDIKPKYEIKSFNELKDILG